MFSSKLAGILAAVATVCFLALLALQVVEITGYRAAPSVWPAAQQ